MVGQEMTVKALKASCEKNKLYRTARLNDKMYLHYVGWESIANLDEYTGLKVLWLEGNGLLKIEGLEHQSELRTLYLQENVIEKIENLEALTCLDTLNLSQNFVSKIENMGHMKELKTLIISQNRLATAADVEHIATLPEVSCLDIQKNKIDDLEIVNVLERMPKLAVLYLQGNPVVKKIKFYRKSLIAKLKALKYLDDKPVFEEERLRAEAWCRGLEEGGDVEAARQAEQAEIDRQRLERRAKEEKNFRAFEAMMLEGRRIRAEREAEAAVVAAKALPGSAAAPDSAPSTDNVELTQTESDIVPSGSNPECTDEGISSPPQMPHAAPTNPHSGETIVQREEAPETKAFRMEKLTRAQARADEEIAKTNEGSSCDSNQSQRDLGSFSSSSCVVPDKTEDSTKNPVDVPERSTEDVNSHSLSVPEDAPTAPSCPMSTPEDSRPLIDDVSIPPAPATNVDELD